MTPSSPLASTPSGSPTARRSPRALRAQRVLCAALAASALVAGLTACAPLIVGGAVVGGVMAVDRRTAGTQVEDEGIELRASNRIREALGDRVHVNVTSYNRQVLLTGEVPNAQDRQSVEQIVGGVDNVRSVVNDLAVMPSTSLGQRSNDTFITGKVRASLVDAKDITATAFKVVTERNIVYLMGRVSQREAQRATEITRGVSGVSKVVRVFEIVSEEELRRIAPQPAPVTTDTKPAGG
ncbi:BON domain-containing protein [Paracidovorax sp. MALMAid1276]|uniref:BON domain-containing protein n=1 Tax=Paracidovorax sp. MALMAid1276 TaxID=3411631 RepID=UPI003B9CF482